MRRSGENPVKSPQSRKARRAAPMLLAAWLLVRAAAHAETVRLHGGAAELSIGAMSERTARIVIAPLDAEGKPRPAPPSTVLVPGEPRSVFLRRDVDAPEVVSLGKLRVEVKPGPLTISIRGPSGRVVQELVLSDDGKVGFRAGAPILGMGEGAKQFDRRGALYSMEDGWGAWNRAVLGSWIAVPFLIGTDGWALFFHHPRGAFDLRESAASFQPAADQRDVPLEVFAIAWEKPADVLEEYGRLTGRAPMPPRWTLGYMQSHRTLGGPDEVIRVAETFREKGLPCDALIYLGTGYCPAGWNTGHGSLEFNPKTFDKPAEIIDRLHALDFRVVLHKNRAPRTLSGLSVNDPPEARGPESIAAYWEGHGAVLALGVDGWWPAGGVGQPREAGF